jgi:hypothetical protein
LFARNAHPESADDAAGHSKHDKNDDFSQHRPLNERALAFNLQFRVNKMIELAHDFLVRVIRTERDRNRNLERENSNGQENCEAQSEEGPGSSRRSQDGSQGHPQDRSQDGSQGCS